MSVKHRWRKEWNRYLAVWFIAVSGIAGYQAMLRGASPFPLQSETHYPLERENCRLFGAVLRPPASFQILEMLGAYSQPDLPQRNGWSLAVYSDYFLGGRIGIPGKPLIMRSYKNILEDRTAYLSVAQSMWETNPNIMISHLRNASSGCNFIVNPHPFVREYEGKTYLFTHNGGVWGHDLKILIDELLEAGAEPECCPDQPIDSEFLFMYLMQLLRISEESTLTVCRQWLVSMVSRFGVEWNALNFMLTDGTTIWTGRCSRYPNSFTLYHRDFDFGGGYAISTKPLGTGWTRFNNMMIGEFRAGKRPRIETIKELEYAVSMLQEAE